DFAAAYQTKIVPAAGRAFEKLLAGYRAGRAGFPDLLDAQEEFADARLSLLEAEWDMNRSYALLYKIAGPAMNNIQIKELKGDL
ncbi:MAG: TolC family protein, partial [Deltaproteobacteria bacterium]|nr:TolC family protein [Deltaproteobacteria bacterium]